MSQPAIVVVAYNRPHSLQRLLLSLKNANYDNFSDITLIISIDYSYTLENEKVKEISKKFSWGFGPKEIIKHSSNLGLRNHVLSCGDLTNKYGSIIMLEDDLYVSPDFYLYSKKMLENYDNDLNIAGISLYNHKKNPNNWRPFNAGFNGYDIYFLQFAQSWGQCWSKRMWSDFFHWYEKNETWEIYYPQLPEFVNSWPESSWLKYFIKYLVDKDKFFVYPYFSRSTNFNEVGTHNTNEADSSFQVELCTSKKTPYLFPTITEAVIYDVFFERADSMFTNRLAVNNRDICIDLYATKTNFNKKRYWLSTRLLNYKIIQFYGLDVKPHELNIELVTQGKDIFLYDTSFADAMPESNNKKKILTFDYPVSGKVLIDLLKIKIKQKFSL
ncbi:glycosyltransferase [Gillisia sp. JM1]|uniref:glycosyltransferase n=1 Tax=Gillisia sp. JM1 TaxID=1283286 RepID=UPI000423DC93|nr:glycosyltransferase [Gillisia sp. JM1]